MTETEYVLEREVVDLKLTIEKLTARVTQLQEQIDWYNKQIFGPRTEKTPPPPNPKQLLLFELEELKETNEESKEIKAHTRKKPNRNGKDQITLPEDLPTETTVIDLPEKEKVCALTGKPLAKVGEETTCKLAFKPGAYFIKKYVRMKYALPQEVGGIKTPELPDTIIPKCRVDESFLAEMMTRKYVDHLPFYRVSEILRRDEIFISRKLLSQWAQRLGKELQPLYDLMIEKTLKSGNVFIDETPITTMKDKKSSKGYMWVLVGGQGPNPPYRVYSFRENRSYQHAYDLLAGYKGVFHSDKYAAYENLALSKQMTWCPCWVHIRRKFYDAQAGDPPFREWVLKQIQELFKIDKESWELSPEERLLLRQEKGVPLIDDLIKKVIARQNNGKILPKSKFKEALGYFRGLIPHMKNWAYHANSRLDNNVAERAIRPLALGRKNWLFFGSQEAGKSAAVLLSLVQTCRNLEINPREYLEDLFRNYMSHNNSRHSEWLPDEWLARQNKTSSTS